MRIIDTHSHIYSKEFNEDREEVVSRAKKAGVEAILLPNINSSSIQPLNELSAQHPNYCIPMMGLHPTSVKEDWEEQLSCIKQQFSDRKYIAVGEIGIDLYWDTTFKQQQEDVFIQQLQWSIEYNLPVAIHAREANKECVECIQQVGKDKLRGVFHSFSGTEDELKSILDLGNFMLGINGVVTFKNSNLSTVLKHADISQIIIETDAPYLSPVPYRGKRNEPSYTTNIVNKLSEIYNISPSEIGEITSNNAERLFKISSYINK